MAKVNWSWKPGKQPARAKLEGPARVQGSPRSTVPHYEQKTEKAATGGWGQGPGNNVCNTANGVNAAQGKMAAHMDAQFGDVFKARRRHRRETRHLAGKRKVPTICMQGPMPAPKPVVQQYPHLDAGSTDVALKGWQKHALERLRTKR